MSIQTPIIVYQIITKLYFLLYSNYLTENEKKQNQQTILINIMAAVKVSF